MTDADRDVARRVTDELELRHAALRQVAFPEEPSVKAEPFRVIAFRDATQIEDVAPHAAGMWLQRGLLDLEDRPTLLLPAEMHSAAWQIFSHEMSHAFVAEAWSWAPLWLNEGLAEYLSTIEIRGRHAIVGHVAPRLVAPEHQLPSVDFLVHADARAFYAQETDESHQHYSGAWLLVHMFMNGPDAYRRSFQAFVHDVNSGKAYDRAWSRHFSNAKQLEADYREYAHSDRLPLMSAEVATTTGLSSPRERALVDSEVHVLRAGLSPNLETARQELDLADQHGSGHEVRLARGIWELQYGRVDGAIRVLEPLTRETEEPRVLFAYAAALEKRGDRDTLRAVAERLARVAKTVDQRTLAAIHLANAQQIEAAEKLVTEALRASPNAWRARAVQARLFAQECRFEDAVQAQERALAFLPDRAVAARNDLLRQLEMYRRQPNAAICTQKVSP